MSEDAVSTVAEERPSPTAAWRLNEAGEHAAAERMCRELVAADPDDAEAWCSLGVVLDSRRRYDDAVESYRRATALQPVYPVAHNNLGNTLIGVGRLDEAGESLRCAVAQKPNYARAYFNLGVLGMAQRQFGAAIDSFRRSLHLQPGEVAALIALGVAQMEAGDTDEAIASFEEVLGIEPQHHEACYGLATALGNRGDLVAGTAWLRRAMELNPSAPHLASTWLCALQYNPHLSPAQVYQAHLGWAKRYAPPPGDTAHTNDWEPQRRLRVGYVSPDLRAHPVTYFFEPILANHEPDRVEAICYADVRATDTATDRLKSLAHGWRSIAGLADDEVARMIREDRIDILVDLSGHTAHHRLTLFARRLAPVQVSYIGYPGTTGLDAIDYCLVDEVTAPDGEEAFFSEWLVRLLYGFCCYAGAPDAPDPGRPPALENGFVTFGSLHKPIKINEAVIDLWAAAMHAVPDSRLLLVRQEMTDWVQRNLRREFSRRGIAARRLAFGRHLDKPLGHLKVYCDIDISLDTIPWNGHATACDSLWMGVPIITLRGDRHAGRMTASVLTQLDMQQFIADSPEAFRQCAVSAASDLDRLAELRRGLRERMRASNVGQGDRFTAALEEAYRAMWLHKCEEMRP